jgi:hypothetical protein
VIANRILASEEVVDAYGHVSVRHPDNPNRFLIARSLAPKLVGPEDIVALDPNGQPVRDEDRSLYLERFIHAAIFVARPDVIAVVHAHAEDTLSQTPSAAHDPNGSLAYLHISWAEPCEADIILYRSPYKCFPLEKTGCNPS